ncbi:MAG TPA: hypothetical protein VLQ29_15475 [Candidatus Dormibacteraeota bacterium]|nr:hypothetical protein [Candidatus Dormibacteraeota bacterium]
MAGDRGLTKLQITGDVFNRHATKFEIDEALRRLHDLNLATCKQETTAGRPAERWFYKAQPREVSEESALIEGKTGDTSLSSHPSPSQNAGSAAPDAEPKTAEPVVGDELGIMKI